MGIYKATEKLMENKSKYDFLLFVIFTLTACKWNRSVLATTILMTDVGSSLCWWLIFRKMWKKHRHNDWATNILKPSPSYLSHQHDVVIIITVANTTVGSLKWRTCRSQLFNFWNLVFLAVAFYFIRKYIQLVRHTSKKSESALLNGKSGHPTAYQSTVSTRPVSNVNSPPPLVEKNLGELTAFTTVLLQPKMSVKDSQ